MTEALETRLEALENRLNDLEQRVKTQIDLYRAIQVSDEDTIRHLYNSLEALKNVVESLLPTRTQ